MLTRLMVAIAAMVATVAASNFLVQFPVAATLFGVDLGAILTWGAFTYPVAFLVTDLANRHFGPARARLVVIAGFAIAVLLSVLLATPRIAIASGTAFLTAQFLDISIFDWLRRSAWWRAPLISSLISSALDTLIFFGLAFAPAFGAIDAGFGMADGSLGDLVPLLAAGPDVPLWLSLAAGDYIVKLIMALLLLAPYGALRRVIADRTPARA